jgi:hypothetical protein
LFIIIINNVIGLNGFYKIIFPPFHFSKKWCKTTFKKGCAKMFGSTFSKGGAKQPLRKVVPKCLAPPFLKVD